MTSIRAFERITISDASILEYPATQRILKNLGKWNLLPTGFESPEVIDAASESHRISFEAISRPAPENHPVALGKRILHLTTSPGAFIKQCPGTNNMLCCHYYIVNMVANCPFDCSYCFLQTYLNQPMITFYVNEDDVYHQVRSLCEHPPVNQFRVGTGEISDSLALDPITEFSARLAEVMAPYPNVRLELKTKSTQIEHLRDLPRKNHVTIAWSVNAPAISAAEEHGTPGFHDRIRAAALACELGFSVAFHFDPMIYTPGWQDLYRDAVQHLLDTIAPEKIQWISVGGLRYQPQLRPIALRRRPTTGIFFEDSVTGADGKVRYLRGARVEMFQFLNQQIKQRAPEVYTYLCMESRPVWEKALGRLPDRDF